jgi:hypothetical protein
MYLVCQEWGHTGGQPRLLEVQAMLETALQSSSCEGDEYAERLYVVIHDAFEANPSSLHKSHPQFSHRSRVPGPFVSRNCECDCPPFSIMHCVAIYVFNKVLQELDRDPVCCLLS